MTDRNKRVAQAAILAGVAAVLAIFLTRPVIRFGPDRPAGRFTDDI